MKQPTVLVIDDEDSHRFLIVHALRRNLKMHSFGIDEAAGATEALQKVGEHVSAQQPLLVLSDQRMPEMTGIELLRLVRSRYPQARVRFVLVTSSEHPQDAKESLAQGADGFVVKPLDLTQFRASIDGVLRDWFASLGRPGAARGGEGPKAPGKPS